MTATALYRPPELSLRFAHVWRRNLLVWKKLAIASVLSTRPIQMVVDVCAVVMVRGCHHRQSRPALFCIETTAADRRG